VLRRNLPDLAEEVERLKKEYEKKEILQEGEVDVSDSESVMIDDVMSEQEGEEWGLDLSQEKNAQSLVSLVERAWGVAEKQVFASSLRRTSLQSSVRCWVIFIVMTFPVGTTYLGILFRRRFLEVWLHLELKQP
jgi:hypothetical protein